MTFITECDGCGTRIAEGEAGMEGRRAGTPGLAPGTFHWCQGCAEIAHKAVRESKPSDSQADAIRDMMAEAMEHPGRVVTR